MALGSWVQGVVRLVLWHWLLVGVQAGAEEHPRGSEGAGLLMAGLVQLLCMTLNVNGLHMTEGRGGGWRAGRRLKLLWERARERGWVLMVITETHHSLRELKAVQEWWKSRGYCCWGTPGVKVDVRWKGGVCAVWKPDELCVYQTKVVHVARLIRLHFRWIRSGQEEVLEGAYMPVRFGAGRLVSGVWDTLESEAERATMIVGDLNAEGSLLRRGKESTVADERLDRLIGGEWHRVGGEDCTYRDSVIDHWLVCGRGVEWRGGAVTEGLSGEGEHRVLEVAALVSSVGCGIDRVIKLPLQQMLEEDWEEYRLRVREKMEGLGLLGEETVEGLEGRAGLELMQQIELQVVKEILGRRGEKRGRKMGEKGELERHKSWVKLREWVDSRQEGDTVFEELWGHKNAAGRWVGCRLGRERQVRELCSREMTGEMRRHRIRSVCKARVKLHWQMYVRAREHSWSTSMQRLRAVQRRGGSVIHEAFRIARGRAQGGLSKVVEVWEEGEVVGGPAVREAVARQGSVIN